MNAKGYLILLPVFVAHKNPYNDPDVTVGLAIVATVELLDKTSDEDSVIITGGEGVGKITKPGLQIPVGNMQ